MFVLGQPIRKNKILFYCFVNLSDQSKTLVMKQYNLTFWWSFGPCKENSDFTGAIKYTNEQLICCRIWITKMLNKVTSKNHCRLFLEKAWFSIKKKIYIKPPNISVKLQSVRQFKIYVLVIYSDYQKTLE